MHREIHLKLSSREPIIQMVRNPVDMVEKFARKNKIRSKMAPLEGASFDIGLYREIHGKRSLSKTTELILTKFDWKHI